MVRRLSSLLALVLAVLVLGAVPALACGGLVAPGHAEVLRRATTLAAWHDGVEHYVTGFQFAGSASSFGYIIPLPAEPTKIEKGGEWTLERLVLEVSPFEALAVAEDAARTASAGVEVLQKVRVDALDIIVVRGGGADVYEWARANGFDMTPDTPDVLRSYSSRGAIFALAKFDGVVAAERGLAEGEGTVIHFTIPTPAPWIPLRILSLGKAGPEIVNADLFVLTDRRPQLSPDPGSLSGVEVLRSEPAAESLLADLRSDRGMDWMPSGMWLTALAMHTEARSIDYDLSIDGGGPPPVTPPVVPDPPEALPWAIAGVIASAAAFFLALRLPVGPRPRPV